MPSNAQRITRLTTPSPWSLLLEKLKLYNRRTEAHPVVLVSGVSQDHWRRLLWIVHMLHILKPSARFPTLLLCQNAWSLSSYCSFRGMARFYDQGILKLLGRHFSEAMLLNATECYWMLLISMKTFQKCSTDSTTSLVAGLCRLPKLQVCELSDLNKLNQIDLCMSFVHWCGDISMAEAKSFWSLCLLRCFRNMCLCDFWLRWCWFFWPMTAQQHWQLGSLIELWIIVLQRDCKLLPGLERLPALDFIGTPMADRASYPGLQDNLPRAQDWSSE